MVDSLVRFYFSKFDPYFRRKIFDFVFKLCQRSNLYKIDFYVNLMCFLEQVDDGLDSRDDIRVVDIFMRDFLYFFYQIL